MKLISHLQEEVDDLPHPIALTIGVFDGVHLGHLRLIKELHHLTKRGGTRALITFTNHPSSILCQEKYVPFILSFKHRIHLLEKYGINLILALPFTKELAHQNYETFLSLVYRKLPFSHLVLGQEAAFGKNREGNEKNLKILEKKMGFQAHFLKKEYRHKEIISSQAIRGFIREGKLKKVKKMLGRPYSLWRSFKSDFISQEEENLFSWSFKEKNLCHLPSGLYGVNLEWEEKKLLAVAFLNGQETLHDNDLLITIYFDLPFPNESYVNICFVKYLCSKIDPSFFKASQVKLLEALSTQPSLS